MSANSLSAELRGSCCQEFPLRHNCAAFYPFGEEQGHAAQWADEEARDDIGLQSQLHPGSSLTLEGFQVVGSGVPLWTGALHGQAKVHALGPNAVNEAHAATVNFGDVEAFENLVTHVPGVGRRLASVDAVRNRRWAFRIVLRTC